MQSQVNRTNKRVIVVEDGPFGAKGNKRYTIPANEFNPRRLFEARKGVENSMAKILKKIKGK